MLKRTGRETFRAIILGGLLSNQPSAENFDVPKPQEPTVEHTAQTVAKSTDLNLTTQPHTEKQIEAEKTPGSLFVTIRVEHNVKNKSGQVIGMAGRQSLEYIGLDGKAHSETQTVHWTEDDRPNVSENGASAYEYPAQPADFSLFKAPAGWKSKYVLASDHPEGGITLHGLGKSAHSEGCILASDPFRRRIEHEAGAGPIHVEILPITDARNPADIATTPLPYSQL